MGDKVSKLDIDTRYNKSKVGQIPGRNNLLKKGSAFPEALAFKVALDAGLIKEGDHLFKFEFETRTVSDATTQTFSDGIGGISIIRGRPTSGTGALFPSLGNSGKVEQTAINLFNSLKKGGANPLIAMVLRFSDSPATVSSVEKKITRTRLEIVQYAEELRSQLFELSFGTFDFNKISPLIKKYFAATLELTTSEFNGGAYDMVWNTFLNDYNVSFNVVEPDGNVTNVNYSQSTILSGLPRNELWDPVPATQEQIVSGRGSWTSRGGSKNSDAYIKLANGEPVPSPISGTAIVFYKREDSVFGRIGQIFNQARSNTKSSGIIAENDFNRGTGKGATVSSKIDKDREDENKSISAELSDLNRLFKANLGAGNYIIRDDTIDSLERTVYRVSKVSETILINDYINTFGKPSSMITAEARNESFSFDKSVLNKFRDGLSSSIDTHKNQELSPIRKADLGIPTSKSFNTSDLITSDEIFPLETPYFQALSNNSSSVVTGVSGFSREVMKSIAVSSAGNRVSGQFKVPTNSDTEFLKRFTSEQKVGMIRRNQIYNSPVRKAETHAVLRIVRPNDIENTTPVNSQTRSTGKFQNNMDGIDIDNTTKQASGGFVIIMETDNFILQNVEESDAEKMQLIETFGEPIAFFFGRRPRIYTFSGVLMNSDVPDLDGRPDIPNGYLWKDLWKSNYDSFIRGTKCVENRAKAQIAFDDSIREGFIISSSMSEDTGPNMVRFSFQMFVTREVHVRAGEAIQQNTPALRFKSIESANTLGKDAGASDLSNQGTITALRGQRAPLGTNTQVQIT